jgi:hypothetical protein
MAARKKKPPAAVELLTDTPVVDQGQSAMGMGQVLPRVIGKHEVREVEDARALLTLGPDAKCWTSPARIAHDVGIPLGSIVRVLPPPDASDEAVAFVRTSLEAAGAAVVRVLPRRKGSVLPQARPAEVHKTTREVVEQLVGESNVEDREALRLFCAGVMERCRL